MTKQKVSIYIGSYGDPKKSLHFNIGLLDVWFKYNPFLWQLGLCVLSAKEISINKEIICTLTGPLASFVIAAVAYYFTFSFDLHGSLKLISIIFLGSAILDLFVNLMPITTPIKLYDGSLAYNDGYQLKQLFYHKRFPNACEQGVELYNQQKFAEAATYCTQILKSGFKNGDIYRLAISSFLELKNYNQAKKLSDEFLTQGEINSDDFANAAISYSQLDQHAKAINLYDKSLELNPNNKYSLNNKGFTLTIFEKFEEAIPLFDKAIEIDEIFACSYGNRGLARIKIGKEIEGLEDINYSLKLDENNSYAFRNLGIYYLDKEDYKKALGLLRKAKELDKHTHMIEELIIKAEREGN